jgi:hypothetical protein
MSNDKMFIYDHQTNKQLVRDMTNAEQAERNSTVTAYLQQQAQIKTEAEALRQTKISAYEKLGLTQAEIEALLPTPVEVIS